MVKYKIAEQITYDQRGSRWEIDTNFSLQRKTLTILDFITPYLLQESTDDVLSNVIKNSFKVNAKIQAGKLFNIKKFRYHKIIVENKHLEIESWNLSVDSNDIEIVIADLNIMGIIEPGIKKRAIRDRSKYWKLTELGLELYKNRRKIP